MLIPEDVVTEIEDLKRRVAELEREREQALVAAEDAREELRALAGQHDELERQLAAKQREVGHLHTLLAQREADLRRAKEEADLANQAKARFLAAASHDLRQPTQAAALYLGLLQQPLGKAARSRILSLLGSSIESLHTLLDGLLDLSRLEAGVIQPTVNDFSPSQLMTRLAEEFGSRAEAVGASLHFLPSSPSIRTDPHLLEQVLYNLLANAVTHTGRGRVLFGCRRRRGGLEFQILDTGPGIAPQDRDVIFEEFRQLHNSERNSSRGLGLGLAIVARIARLLGLEIKLQSEVGRGSVFSVIAPLSPADMTQAAPATIIAERDIRTMAAGRLALLVEDDDAIRNALSMLLESWGIMVVAAATSDDLTPQLDRLNKPPNLLIADYRLPAGVTGAHVYDLVRSRWPVAGIILTGDTAPERLREARASGCRLLHKPVDPEELAVVLGEVLDGEPPVTTA